MQMLLLNVHTCTGAVIALICSPVQVSLIGDHSLPSQWVTRVGVLAAVPRTHVYLTWLPFRARLVSACEWAATGTGGHLFSGWGNGN